MNAEFNSFAIIKIRSNQRLSRFISFEFTDSIFVFSISINYLIKPISNKLSNFEMKLELLKIEMKMKTKSNPIKPILFRALTQIT